MTDILKKVMDGWSNVVTGLGVLGKDKGVSSTVKFIPLDEHTLETLYAADDIAAKVVNIIPNEAVRKWIDINDASKEKEEKLLSDLQEIKTQSIFKKALEWSRLYGGSAILMNTQISNDLSKPLPGNAKIVSLVVLNRFELKTITINSDIKNNNFGKPEIYEFNSNRINDGVNIQIHYTRLLRFDGVELPIQLSVSNDYWGDSILTKLYDILRNYSSAHDSIALIIQDDRQPVLKVKGLADIVSQKNGKAAIDRLTTLSLARSALKTVIIDTEEDFTHQTSNLSGIKDIIDAVNNRLVAATGLPHTIILGESPSGLGASGESEKRDFYDTVSQYQENVIRPQLEILLEIINGKPVKFEFNPLWQMGDKEKAETRKLTAETDVMYISNGVLDPEEVTRSRFSKDGYSSEITIDWETREKLKGIELEEPIESEIEPNE